MPFLVSERKAYDVMFELVKLYGFYTNDQEGLTMLKDKLIKSPDLDKFNFFSRLVFITEDLDLLIKELQNSVDPGVNQGIQK